MFRGFFFDDFMFRCQFGKLPTVSPPLDQTESPTFLLEGNKLPNHQVATKLYTSDEVDVKN